jgi:hypothetical protein
VTAPRRPRHQRPSRINFGPGVTWSAVSTYFDERTVDNPRASLEVRLLAAARARIDPTGHSHWARGELRSRLVVFSPIGSLEPVERSTLGRAIGRLVRAKILLPGSYSECLVYEPFAVQTGMTNGSWPPCPKRRDVR